MSKKTQFISLPIDAQRIKVEYQWLNSELSDALLLVFLHEGLGSLSMWKQFPQRLCDELHCRGLVYSRPAYGESELWPADEKWEVNFMHRQAYEILPTLLQALNVDTVHNTPWFLGHSDGASITLLYASKFPEQAAGLIALAPHIMVEELTISSIEKARTAYEKNNLREKLANYHKDIDSTFWRWNDVWLNPCFLDWRIEDEIENITCPILAAQGLDDEYGTIEQIRGIKRKLPNSQLLELPNCGHSPHRDQTEALIKEVKSFIHNHKQE